MAGNTLGYATPGFVSGVPLNHPGTQQAIIAKGFKKRLRDTSILPYITNNTYQGEFRHSGTEIQIPILPIITPYRMKPGDKMKYQIPKSTVESFFIGREMGWGLAEAIVLSDHLIVNDGTLEEFQRKAEEYRVTPDEIAELNRIFAEVEAAQKQNKDVEVR